MLFARIKRTDPEAVYAIMKNADSVALANGYLVVHHLTAADGVSVVGSTSATQLTVAGVVKGDIPVGGYGLVQIYGYHPSVYSAAGVTAGAAFKTSATQFQAAIGVTADDPVAQAGIALTAVSSNRFKGFIRCM
jgi:hypothetical protein